jgi:hypothetical protein
MGADLVLGRQTQKSATARATPEPLVNLPLCDHLGYLLEKVSCRVTTNCLCGLKPCSLPTAFTIAEAHDHLGPTLMVAGVSLASGAFSGRAGQWVWLRLRWCLPC